MKWSEFTGQVLTTPCNIRLKSDDIIENCFLKDGRFLEIDGTGRTFKKDDVKFILTLTWEQSLKISEKKEKDQFK